MATSGSYEQIVQNPILFWDDEVSLGFRWERTAYSPVGNSSTISWAVYVKLEKNVATLSFDNTPITVSIDGTSEVKHYTGTLTSPSGQITTHDIATGSTTLAHNTNGDKTFSYTVAIDDGQRQWTLASNGELDKIIQIAKLTSSPNFNDEESPTISYTNISGNLVSGLEACIASSNDEVLVPYRDISKTGTSYTFPLTFAERQKLRQYITKGSQANVKFYIHTTIGSQNYYSYHTRTLSLINHEPTISPSVIDANGSTVALTGSNEILVRGASTASYTMNPQARKEATIAKLTVKCGEQVIEDENMSLFGNVESNQFIFTITDSRGNTAEQTISKEMVPYVRLTATARIKEFNLNGALTFSISGQYFQGSFGAADNTFSIKYTLKKNGQVVSEDVALNPASDGTFTVDNGHYTYDYTISGLLPKEADGTTNSYSIQATVGDKIVSSLTTEEVFSMATPIFDWGRNYFNFNVPVHFELGFTNNVGLKMASFVRTIDISKAGSHQYCSLEELGLTSDNTIYSLSGAIAYENKIYPIPSPALSNGVGAYSIADATKLWIEGDKVYLTTGAAWGAVSIRLFAMYF